MAPPPKNGGAPGKILLPRLCPQAADVADVGALAIVSAREPYRPSFAGFEVGGSVGSRAIPSRGHSADRDGEGKALRDAAPNFDTSGTDWLVGGASSSGAMTARTFRNSAGLDSHLREVAGRELHTLHLGDVRRSKHLQGELQQLKLMDFFDANGNPRFRRMGLSIAAKQQEGVKDTFGSQLLGAVALPGQPKGFSAKALLLSEEALAKDAKQAKTRTVAFMRQFRKTGEDAWLHDVGKRQLEMLFSEVPGFRKYLPPDVKLQDLLPVDVSKEDEIKASRSAKKMDFCLLDSNWTEGRRMEWLLSREQVLLVAKAAELWERAARGDCCPLGMDRPTFCRFVLDVGLVDQETVPYYWAVSLFDSVGQPVRCCAREASWSSSAPAAMVVHHWGVLAVLDILLRQHFDQAKVGQFLKRLSRAARRCLPERLADEFDKCEMDHLARCDALKRMKKSRAKRGGPQAPESNGRAGSGQLGAGGSGVSPGGQVATSPGAATVAIGATEQPEGRGGARFPVWLTFPEKPAASVDIEREIARRDRLVCSMLVEPEVLHLTMQHLVLFNKLHACYADEASHMDFASVLQFCTDFRVAPELVSTEFLKVAYESVYTAEGAVTLKDRPSSPKDPGRFSPSRPAGPKRERISIVEPSDTDDRACKASPVFGAPALLEILLRSAFVYLGYYGNTVQQSSDAYARVVWLLVYMRYVFTHLKRSYASRCQQSPAAQQQKLQDVHQKLHEALQIPLQLWYEPPPPEPRQMEPMAQPRPGHGAKRPTNPANRRRQSVVEAIVGPPIMLPRLRPTITSLRFISKLKLAVRSKSGNFSSKPRAPTSPGLDSSDSEGQTDGATESMEPDPLSPASPASQASPASVPGDEEPSADELQDDKIERAKILLRAGEKWSMEELFEVEAGTPCIVNGSCSLCRTRLTGNGWGNPRCRGCSSVDAFAFERHPLSPLLTDWTRQQRRRAPEASRPPQVDRVELTPPLLGCLGKMLVERQAPQDDAPDLG